MNKILLNLCPTNAHPPDWGVDIWIDGISLIEMLRELERPWWVERKTPQPEGQYVWVPGRDALQAERHLLGEPTIPWCEERSAVVVCNCGEYACRSYAPRITLSDDRVVWTAWREFPPEEAREVEERLPSLTFDRAQYMDELQRVSEEYRRIRCCD